MTSNKSLHRALHLSHIVFTFLLLRNRIFFQHAKVSNDFSTFVVNFATFRRRFNDDFYSIIRKYSKLGDLIYILTNRCHNRFSSIYDFRL